MAKQSETYIGADEADAPAKPDPILDRMKANVKEQMAAKRARMQARVKAAQAALTKAPRAKRGR